LRYDSHEPLVSSELGPPFYITRRLTPEQRRDSAELRGIRVRFEKLTSSVPEKGNGSSPRERLRFIVRAIDHVQEDLAV
jgi:hypothetical protein